MINPISVRIAIISYNVPGVAVKAIKMFFNKVFEVKVDSVPKSVVCHATIGILPGSVENVFLDEEVISSLEVN